MGTIQHNVIIVTGGDRDSVESARNVIIDMINSADLAGDIGREIDAARVVTEIVEANRNDYYSFMIGPDGSKEGWEFSNDWDNLRKEIRAFLKRAWMTFIEVSYGEITACIVDEE